MERGECSGEPLRAISAYSTELCRGVRASVCVPVRTCVCLCVLERGLVHVGDVFVGLTGVHFPCSDPFTKISFLGCDSKPETRRTLVRKKVLVGVAVCVHAVKHGAMTMYTCA